MEPKTLYLTQRFHHPSRLWLALAALLGAVVVLVAAWRKPDSFGEWYYVGLALFMVVMLAVATYTRRVYGPPRVVLDGSQLTVRGEGYRPARAFLPDEIEQLRIDPTQIEVLPISPRRKPVHVPVRSYAAYQWLKTELIPFARFHGIPLKRT
jgi:hypothetical protein